MTVLLELVLNYKSWSRWKGKTTLPPKHPNYMPTSKTPTILPLLHTYNKSIPIQGTPHPHSQINTSENQGISTVKLHCSESWKTINYKINNFKSPTGISPLKMKNSNIRKIWVNPNFCKKSTSKRKLSLNSRNKKIIRSSSWKSKMKKK